MESKSLPICRIALFGDAESGKTSIITRIAEKDFNEEYIPTMDMPLHKREIQKEATHLTQDIWEVGRNKVVFSLLPTYFRRMKAFIFVMDGTKSWEEQIARQLIMLQTAKDNSPNAKIYIVINKADREDFTYQDSDKDEIWNSIIAKTQIPEENLAIDAIFACSAKSGANIFEVFEKIADDFVDSINLKDSKIETLASDNLKINNLDFSNEENFVTAPQPLFTPIKVWFAINALLFVVGITLFILSVFSVGSFLTFGGILPAAMIGAGIITVGALVIWNVVYGIYTCLSNKPNSIPPLNIKYESEDDVSLNTHSTSVSLPEKQEVIESNSRPIFQSPQNESDAAASSLNKEDNSEVPSYS